MLNKLPPPPLMPTSRKSDFDLLSKDATEAPLSLSLSLRWDTDRRGQKWATCSPLVALRSAGWTGEATLAESPQVGESNGPTRATQ